MGILKNNFTESNFTESNFTYDERRIIDAVEQILNLRSNIFEDRNNIDLVFDIYEKALSSQPSHFSTSLNSTRLYLNKPSDLKYHINNLDSNNPDSFIIIPLMSKDHVFAALVRSNNENYSVTIINKLISKNYNQYEEYIFNKKDYRNLLQSIENATSSKNTTSEIYQFFKTMSSLSKTIDINSKNQKKYNCFVKEPQEAIKYAFLTSSQLKSLSTNSSNTNSSNTNSSNTTLEKTENFTLWFNKLFIDKLKNYKPSLCEYLDNIFDIYNTSKGLKKQLESGIPLESALNFNNKNLLSILNELTPDIISSHKDSFMEIAEKNLQPNEFEVFKNIINLYNDIYSPPFNPMTRFNNINASLTKNSNYLNQAKDLFPFIEKSICTSMNNVFSDMAGYLSSQNYHIEAQKFYTAAINIFPDVPNNYKNRAISKLKSDMFEEAIDDLSKAIEINPNDKQAYRYRATAYKQIGYIESYSKDLRRIKEIEKDESKKFPKNKIDKTARKKGFFDMIHF